MASLRSMVQGLLDSTDLDERIVQGVRDLPKSTRELGRYLTPSKIMGGNIAEVGRLAMQTPLAQKSGLLRNYLEGATRAPGAFTAGASFNLLNPLKNNSAQTLGGKMGEFAGQMTGFQKSPITRGLYKITNPAMAKLTTRLSPKIAPFAPKIAPRVATSAANVIQGFAFDAANRRLPTAGSIGLDAVTGFAGSSNQFDDAVKATKSNFALDQRTRDELIDAEEMIKHPKFFIGKIDTGARTEKEAIRKIRGMGEEVVERLSAKYLPNKELYGLKTTQAKINALFKLSQENKLANVPGLGLVDKDTSLRKPQLGSYTNVRRMDNPLQPHLPSDALDTGTGAIKIRQPKKVEISQQQAGENLTGAVIAEDSDTFKKLFSKWIGKKDVANTTATQKAIKFKNIPTSKQKFKEFADLIEGTGKSSDQNILRAEKTFRREMDKVFTEAKDAGVDMGYREGYITHFWDLPREQVEKQYQIFKKKEFIQNERTVPTYDEGIEMGLKPKFDSVGELVNDYVKRVETLKANLDFFKQLKKEGLLVDASIGFKTPGFRPVNAPGFPKSVSTFNGKEYISEFYAPESVANQINKVFSPDERGLPGKVVGITAKASGKLQDIGLSGGIPYTPVNAFSIANAQKELLSGRVKSPVASLFDSLTTNRANKFFQENLPQVKKMQERNIPLRTSYKIENFIDKPTVAKTFGEKIGRVWDKAISVATFQRFLPMLQIRLFNDIEAAAIKQGKSAEEAADVAANAVKNFYGVIGSDVSATRDRTVQDVTSSLLFAPRFRESMINFWINSIKGLKDPLAKENITNTKFLAGAIATYGAMSALNKSINGHYLHENPQGKEDKLLIPLEDGYTLGIPFLSSIATVPRGVYRSGKALLSGDPQTAAVDTMRTFSSMGLRPIADVSMNQNYFGQQIYDPESSIGQRYKDIGKYLGGQLTPSVPKAIIEDTGAGRPKYQTISKALEMPFRFYNSESIKNAPFWETYNQVKPVAQKYDEMKWKQPDQAESFFEQNKDQILAYKDMKDRVKAYYADNKNSKFLQDFEGSSVGDNVILAGGRIVEMDKFDSVKQVPEFTGKTELDKQIYSEFSGEITQRKNDVEAMYKAKIINADQAEQMLSQLEKYRDQAKASRGGTSGGSTKKISISKASPKTVRVSAPQSTFKPTALKITPFKPTTPNIKMKSIEPINIDQIIRNPLPIQKNFGNIRVIG